MLLAQRKAYSQCGLCGNLLGISVFGSQPRAKAEPAEHKKNRADHFEKWRSDRSDLKVTTVYVCKCLTKRYD